jgi:hypothetical protein
MELITLETEAYKQLIAKIENLCAKVDDLPKDYPLTEVWIDIEQACFLLKVSKRTLQNYRNSGLLAYSQVAGKIYFKAADIEEHLRKHYQPAAK